MARPLRHPFTYRAPPGVALTPGQRLKVPFGRAQALGFYLGPAEPLEEGVRVRSVLAVLEDEPALPPDLFALARFAARHYRHPLGEALRQALPPGEGENRGAQAPERPMRKVVVAEDGADPGALKRAPVQAAALQYLLAVGGRALVDELARAVPGSRTALSRMVERGLVRLEEEPDSPDAAPSVFDVAEGVALTDEQRRACDALEEALDEGAYSAFLLQGVTGSGKTEVYLRAVTAAQARGKGALVLVPEIALTPQLVGRFRARFGDRVAVLHSGLGNRERRAAWHALRDGSRTIAVGVRSAIFAPVRELGLVVVDEEHDGSFKAEEKLRYHARDLALVRAREASAVAVLGSATPSLESVENCKRGRLHRLTLSARVDARPLPAVELLDLREARGGPPSFGGAGRGEPERRPLLAPASVDALKEVVARGEQAIVFLNRRGYSTFLVCEACGGSVRCVDCDVSLTLHLAGSRVQCHYCGLARPVPDQCADCRGPLLRLGAGTERLEEEVRERLPEARVARLDRDVVTTGAQLTHVLAGFARREHDILIGTQMVAKGHDFPGVTLVVVVLADGALALPDFRAAERTFQVLTQVAGRAGRGGAAGRVLVQTYNPEAEAIARVVGHDVEGFLEQELEWRRVLAYPPFFKLAAVRLDGADARRTKEAAERLGVQLGRRLPPPESGARLLGPAPAPLARLKGRYRWQLLLKAPTYNALGPLLQEAERRLADLPQGIRGVLDVDPGAML